jgi:DNA modification methylase
VKIEVIDINLLKPYENNAKIHTPAQIAQIIKSIEDFGFNDPIAVDEHNTVIEGHGRLLALKQMGWTQVECIRLDGLTDEQKRAYIHVHNQLTLNTGFDLDILERELQSIEGIDMGAFGFDMDFTIDSDFSFDDGERAASEWESHIEQKPLRTKRGQLWQLGNHRLLVGDSTNARDVSRLTAGAEMDLCITDPPYNVNYEGGNAEHMTILNDNMDEHSFYAFLKDFYEQMMRVLKAGGSYYIFHADSNGLFFRAALQEAGGQVRQNLIWVKNSLVLGRQDYQWKHEPILYGWKEGAGHYFVNDRCQTTTFEDGANTEDMSREELLQYVAFLRSRLDSIPNTVLRENKPTRNDLHPTMKPVALCAKLIQNSSKRGDKVIDFFGGSGSSLMACEETGRICYTMELDERYADGIITRWEESTGERAVLISGNK